LDEIQGPVIQRELSRGCQDGPDARCFVLWPDQHLVITETDPVTLIGSSPVRVLLIAENQTDLSGPVGMDNKFTDSVFWVHVYHFLGGVEA
tara:strand:+ start:247 stop:519 length:273 start_codon:yes stop_codon:yes gene_type:complete